MSEIKGFLKDVLNENPLFVFAMPEEASQEFNDKNILITGVGKANAAYSLTKQISISAAPSIIVNLVLQVANCIKKRK